jgi:hypothetical protein
MTGASQNVLGPHAINKHNKNLSLGLKPKS